MFVYFIATGICSTSKSKTDMVFERGDILEIDTERMKMFRTSVYRFDPGSDPEIEVRFPLYIGDNFALQCKKWFKKGLLEYIGSRESRLIFREQ